MVIQGRWKQTCGWAFVLSWVCSAMGAPHALWHIDNVHLAWTRQHDVLPPVEFLEEAQVSLSRGPHGLTAPISGKPSMRTDLHALGAKQSFAVDSSGLEAMARDIGQALREDGFAGGEVSIWLRQSAGGASGSQDLWILVDLPLPGGIPNTSIPGDLANLQDLDAGGRHFADITLTWSNASPEIPDGNAFLDRIQVPITTIGRVVAPSWGGTIPVGRLRLARSLTWTAKATDLVQKAVDNAVSMLAESAYGGTTRSHVRMREAGDAIEFVADLGLQAQPPRPSIDDVKVVTRAAPSQTRHSAMDLEEEKKADVAEHPVQVATPVKPPVSSPIAYEPAVSKNEQKHPEISHPFPTRLPKRDHVLQTQAGDESFATEMDELAAPPIIGGVEVRWASGVEHAGDPSALVGDTRVKLRLVDGAVQGGRGAAGEWSTLADLRRFPERGWNPSATRAVRRAVDRHLTRLGMRTELVGASIREEPGGRFLVLLLRPPAAEFQMPPAEGESQLVEGELWYAVWPFEVVYAAPHTDLPSVSAWAHLPIKLGRTPIGWSDSSNGERQTVTLAELNDAGSMLYDAGAIRAIGSAIAKVLIDRNLMGVAVQPLSEQIPSSGENAGADLRIGTELTLVVTVGRVEEIRTIARGERIDEVEGENHPVHEHIATGSPLVASNGEGTEGDLLEKKELNEYLYRISRHPGRDVEASVAASSSTGDVAVDFIVSETKPWMGWFQYGNTGTKAEGYQRAHFGFFHSQLTDNDDILSLQYITSNFEDSNTVLGRYEAPFGSEDRLRWGINGSWSQYFSDQFGVTVVSDAFSGSSWSTAGELRWNAYQDGPLFIDLVGGVRLQHLRVTNNLLFNLEEEGSFVIPYGMFQAERAGDWSNVQLTIGLEGNTVSHDALTMARFGAAMNRPDLADRWARLNWAGSLSFFLEPLLNYASWNDPSTPESSTLAHEILIGTSGQFAFNSRLMPQFQSVAGGPGTNRGYPVSIAAGDNAVNLSAEYRFHVPRIFDIQPEPGVLFGESFRSAPQHVYGRPDWDLALLGFVDYSWLTQNDAFFFESDQTMLSAGIGLELLLKRNMSVRLDWGWALRSLQGGLYDSGHNRLYVQASLSF
ncbi:MAG: hypothetical protein MK100_00680 [Phycisphaerales bacterium]|nr:hypothetical protein [Phycisphaerales bacterium]